MGGRVYRKLASLLLNSMFLSSRVHVISVLMMHLKVTLNNTASLPSNLSQASEKEVLWEKNESLLMCWMVYRVLTFF